MNTNSGEPLSSIFTHSPETVADLLSSKDYSAGGPAAGLRMLTVYMAYGGRRLSSSQRQTLQRAKDLLLQRIRLAWAAKQ
jgi:hypothetical protein